MALYATNFFPADGVQTVFPFAFAGVNPDVASGTVPYLYPADVKAAELFFDIDGNATSLDRIVTISAPNQATIVGAPVAAGRIVKIYRSTEIRFPLVDYRDRQSISELDLDLANRQNVFIAQETADVAASGVVADSHGNYDMQGHRVINMAPAIDPGDAVNLAQVLAWQATTALNWRFLLPSPGPVKPTLRDNGEPLQLGDQWMDVTNGNTFVFRPSGWTLQNLDFGSPGGSSMLGFSRNPMGFSEPASLAQYLDGSEVNLWELAEFVTVRPNPAVPSTWDWLPALNKWIENCKLIPNYSRVLHIPRISGGIGISSTWHIDTSNLKIKIDTDIRLTGTIRQKTILIAADTSNAPASALFGIDIEWARGAKVDGNASAMDFEYAHGDGSDNDSTIRFNRVDTFTVRGVHADNGPIDSFSIRQCRNWTVIDSAFTNSKEDNGFSVTTDWDPIGWERGNWDTYGFGTVINCIANRNEDFGMTAFNCSGVRFINCRSWLNRGGYSCEDSFTVKDVKYFDVQFISCIASKCVEQGFYIDGSGVRIDDGCETYDIRGYAGDNSNAIFENGVVVASANDVYVGGKHRNCGRSGIAIFNGTGTVMEIEIKATVRDNAYIGIRARGISRLRILRGTVVKGNGNTLIGGQYSQGINISNSGGADYNQGAGAVIMIGVEIENSGAGGCIVDYVSAVTIDDTAGADNSQSASGSGLSVLNCNILMAKNNMMRVNVGSAQLFGLSVASTVAVAYVWGNRAPNSATAEVSNQSPSRKGMALDAAFSPGTFTPTGAFPNEGGWNVTALGNAVSTIADMLQRAGLFNKS